MKFHQVAFSFLMFAVATELCSCKNRDFNSTGKNSAIRSSASGSSSDYLEPLVDRSLLENKVAPTNEPPADFTQDLILGDGKISQNTFLKADGSEYGTGNLADTPWEVLAYEKVLRISKRGTPAPLAAASVLAILQKNRAEFSKNKEGSIPNDPAMLKMAPPGAPAQVLDLMTLPDSTLPFKKTPCKPFDPVGYNDIKWHYYCSIPVAFRACHRLLVGVTHSSEIPTIQAKTLSREEFLKQIAAAGVRDSENVFAYCTGAQNEIDPKIVSSYDAIISNKEMAAGLPSGSFAKLFKVFYDSQSDPLGTKDSLGKPVNMWNYIMRSQPYAFDFKQQQAVLNYYYGQMKPADQGAFDPQNHLDCSTFRDTRVLVEKDLQETKCDPSVPRARPFKSEGR